MERLGNGLPVKRLRRLPCHLCLLQHGAPLSVARRLETAENCLDGRQPRFGHEIAVRRYWPVRKFGRIVLGFLDERTAHRGFAKARRLIIQG